MEVLYVYYYPFLTQNMSQGAFPTDPCHLSHYLSDREFFTHTWPSVLQFQQGRASASATGFSLA